MQTAVIYTRVSTDDQKENGFSLQDQEARLRRECKKRGIQILEHYQDDASAKTFKRPAFQAFLEAVKTKKIKPDIFMCVRMDRFSRNTLESLNMLQKFKTLNIKLECLENNFDLKTPESLLPFMVNLVLPEIENKRRGLNTKRGMRQALREGRWTGIAPYGYKNNKLTKLVEVDEKRAQIVRFAFETFAKGAYSAEEVRRMAKTLGLSLTKQAFLNMLTNVFYIGKISIPAYDDEPSEEVVGLHEPLVPEETFYQVRHILSGKRKPYKGLTSSENLVLIGLLSCPQCGRPITGSASKGNGGLYHYYHCQRKYGCKTNINAKTANEKFVEHLDSFEVCDEVLELYHHVLEDVFNNDEIEKENERKRLENEIERIKKQVASLDEKFLDNVIAPENYNRLKSDLDEKMNDLVMKHIAVTKMAREFQKYISYTFTLLSDIGGFYASATTDVKRRLIGLLFPESLIYDNGGYRTTKMNEVFRLLCSTSKDFRKKKLGKNAELSTWAPPVGLEPTTL